MSPGWAGQRRRGATQAIEARGAINANSASAFTLKPSGWALCTSCLASVRVECPRSACHRQQGVLIQGSNLGHDTKSSYVQPRMHARWALACLRHVQISIARTLSTSRVACSTSNCAGRPLTTLDTIGDGSTPRERVGRSSRARCEATRPHHAVSTHGMKWRVHAGLKLKSSMRTDEASATPVRAVAITSCVARQNKGWHAQPDSQ